ncbi:AIR synthase related protein, partial [Actinotignum timonense]|uniref:AIR synthase related protein n=1 Tax=Actinotignum timonense TaxID=1870995 RepID=UPI002A8279F6
MPRPAASHTPGPLVRDLSEAELLAQIVPLLPRGETTIVPSGDDSAVLGLSDGRVTVSTDMLVEGVHFRRDWSSGSDVGWRVAAQNIADAVAMGARPRSLVVALELPGDVPVVTESGHSVNAEAVLRLAPTLILTDGTIRGAEGALAQLEASGIPVVRLTRATKFDDAPA